MSKEDVYGNIVKVSFAMRGYEPEEAFRRAVGRYRDDMSGRKGAEPIFTVKLSSVEWCHNSWDQGPFFQWEFVVVEVKDATELNKVHGPRRNDLVFDEGCADGCIAQRLNELGKCLNEFNSKVEPPIELRDKVFRMIDEWSPTLDPSTEPSSVHKSGSGEGAAK